MRKLSEVKIREILSDYWVLQDDCEGMENGWVVKELAQLALLSFQEIPARVADIHLRSPLEVEDIWIAKFKSALSAAPKPGGECQADFREISNSSTKSFRENSEASTNCPKCGGRGSYHCPQMLGTVECECGGDHQSSAPAVLRDVLTAVSIGGSRTELIEALTAIKPKFGAPGSRDVDVRAAHVAIDKAIEKLSNL